MIRQIRVAAFCATLTAAGLPAQAVTVSAPPEAPGRIQGTLFDSLLMRPVVRATVMLMGTGRYATSDSRGRFSFDTVSAGRHEVGFSSLGLDSAGLGVMGTAVGVLARESARVAIATPSLSTLFRNRCTPANTFGKDSTIIWGTVRDAATDSLLSGVTTAFDWFDLRAGKLPGLVVDAMHREAQTDASGNYFACGVPRDVKISIQALSPRAGSGRVEYAVGERRLQYIDLTVSPDMIIPDSVRLVTRADSLEAGRLRGRAQVSGSVVSEKGKPLANAIVMIADLDSAVRTGDDGRFTITRLPAGTQTLSVRRVGSAPVTQIVQLRPDATTEAVVQLSDIPVLAAVNVRSDRNMGPDRQRFESRRQVGFGYAIEGLALARRPDIFAALSGFPGLNVRRENAGVVARMAARGLGGGMCIPTAFLDGVLTDFVIAANYPIEQYRAIEVFANPSQTPAEYYRFGESCGSVLFWTRNSRW